MPLILPANTLDSSYEIDNSLRFNDDDSAKLTKTPSGDGDRQKWTVNCWFKRGNLTDGMLFSVGTYTRIQLSSNTIYIQVSNNDSTAHAIQTNRLLRDLSAWYMITVSCDTTQSTASNRLKLYINGVEETSFSTDQRSAITLNCSTATAGQFEHRIGGRASDIFYDGYISEFNFIDGSQLTPSSFGETNDNGVWIPKKYDGSYGTNGFFQEYKQSGTGTDASGMGADTSGNTNHFAVTNLAATDITVDTPTNNFCTWNPLDGTDLSDLTFSEGNTKVVNATGVCRGTLAAASGKWYWEIKQITTVNGSNPIQYGVADTEDSPPTHGSLNNALIAYSDNDAQKSIKKFASGTESTVSMTEFTSISANDIINFAFDADTAKLWVGKNGTWLHSGNPAGGSNEVASTNAGNFFTPCLEHAGVTYTIEANFGNPSYANSSSVADANGYGAFEYTPPTGFYALCTKNLAEYG